MKSLNLLKSFLIFLVFMYILPFSMVYGLSDNNIPTKSFIIANEYIDVITPVSFFELYQSIELHSKSPYWTNLDHNDLSTSYAQDGNIIYEKLEKDVWESSDPSVAYVYTMHNRMRSGQGIAWHPGSKRMASGHIAHGIRARKRITSGRQSHNIRANNSTASGQW